MTAARRTKLHAPTLAAINAARDEAERRPEWIRYVRRVLDGDVTAMAALVALYREAPALDHVYGPNLERFVRTRVEALVRLARGEPPEDVEGWAAAAAPNWYRFVDSPLHLRADGTIEGAAGATPSQLLQLHSYYDSLRPPGQPGRRADPDTAAQALRMSEDGADWQTVAKALGIDFDRYDKRSRDRASAKVRRLIDRGRANRRQSPRRKPT